ncbi:MAG: hypothetical protein NDI61_05845 [Bdellovibrionaceae bacterium]|nr:hypothetical protein [Pseudobdellovibrionaceae bacterium]
MESQNQTTRRLTLFAILLSALALSGCGARKTARYSSGTFTGASRSALDAGAPCSYFASTTTTLDGAIQTYVLPDGTDSPDMMRVRINGITNEFQANTKYVLKFFRAEAMADNTVRIDPTPLEVRFEADNGLMISGYMNNVSMVDITNMQRAYSLTGSTANDFFRQTDILISNVDLRWDVLMIALYENTSSTESRLVGDVAMLMPEFTADPNVYMTDHPQILHALHPFYNSRTSTTANFADLARAYCW